MTETEARDKIQKCKCGSEKFIWHGTAQLLVCETCHSIAIGSIPDPPIHDYIGDGVYLKYDGYGIWLKANHHLYPTDKVYLEPIVLKSFIHFLERVGFNINELQKE